MRFRLLKFVTSRFFLKWCSSGVVSAVPLRETIDYTGFSGTFQDTAVADEKYFNHIRIFPYMLVFFEKLYALFLYVTLNYIFLQFTESIIT